ncbi:hypothetical protein MMC26_002612 [Xylographa opegraphella]|nr:hypothetical protein [Xylographa opegraphella]
MWKAWQVVNSTSGVMDPFNLKEASVKKQGNNHTLSARALQNGSLDPDPSVVGRSAEIKTPVAVAMGTLDESSIISAMRYVNDDVPASTLQEYKARHIVNLEYRDDFNTFLEEWLDIHFK